MKHSFFILNGSFWKVALVLWVFVFLGFTYYQWSLYENPSWGFSIAFGLMSLFFFIVAIIYEQFLRVSIYGPVIVDKKNSLQRSDKIFRIVGHICSLFVFYVIFKIVFLIIPSFYIDFTPLNRFEKPDFLTFKAYIQDFINYEIGNYKTRDLLNWILKLLSHYKNWLQEKQHEHLNAFKVSYLSSNSLDEIKEYTIFTTRPFSQYFTKNAIIHTGKIHILIDNLFAILGRNFLIWNILLLIHYLVMIKSFLFVNRKLIISESLNKTLINNEDAIPLFLLIITRKIPNFIINKIESVKEFLLKETELRAKYGDFYKIFSLRTFFVFAVDILAINIVIDPSIPQNKFNRIARELFGENASSLYILIFMFWYAWIFNTQINYPYEYQTVFFLLHSIFFVSVRWAINTLRNYLLIVICFGIVFFLLESLILFYLDKLSLGSWNLPSFYEYLGITLFCLISTGFSNHDKLQEEKYQDMIKQKDLENSLVQAQLDQQRLESQALSAQLSSLKNQLNSHFIFNSFSFIQNSVRPLSTSVAEAVGVFANIMRYNIEGATKDESADDKYALTVELENEIAQIENYIKFNRLRKEYPIFINFEIEGPVRKRRILPLLLVNYVENAIKYGIINDPRYPIDIRLKVVQTQLTFYVRNKKDHYARPVSTGVGNDNTQQRLLLVYPNTHTLLIKDETDFYTVSLQIDL